MRKKKGKNRERDAKERNVYKKKKREKKETKFGLDSLYCLVFFFFSSPPPSFFRYPFIIYLTPISVRLVLFYDCNFRIRLVG